MAYIAALWSSPIAWNRVPIIGNVKLEILSERMVKQPPVYSVPRRSDAFGEQLVVRWRTVGKGKNWGLPFINNGSQDAAAGGNKGEGASGTKAPVGMAQAVGSSKEFTGLFIFDFDKEGRILSHTIEHVQEGGQWEKGVGAKVVVLTVSWDPVDDGGELKGLFLRRNSCISLVSLEMCFGLLLWGLLLLTSMAESCAVRWPAVRAKVLGDAVLQRLGEAEVRAQRVDRPIADERLVLTVEGVGGRHGG